MRLAGWWRSGAALPDGFTTPAGVASAEPVESSKVAGGRRRPGMVWTAVVLMNEVAEVVRGAGWTAEWYIDSSRQMLWLG